MSRTTDILIVGGGVIGASIAYYLAHTGAGRVTLLERRALGTGTTGRSGAIIRQHYSNDFTIRVAKESLHTFAHFDELVGGNCGFIRTGLLVLSDEQGTAGLRANVALQQAQGVNTSIIGSQDIEALAPGFYTQDAAVACYEPEAGVADPIATTCSFAQRSQEYGASVQEGIMVTRLLTQHKRIVGVATTQGDIEAPVVILAANVWSVPLAQALGIHLPIIATRHPMLAIRRSPDMVERHKTHAVCFDMMQNVYLRPDSGGITLIGSTNNVKEPDDPDRYAQHLTEEESNVFFERAIWRFPVLARSFPKGGWAGIYDDTPDYHPILGRLAGYEGLYCAAGFSGHGFKLSPVVGQWIAQLVTTGTAPADMLYFTSERFSRKQEIRPRYTSGVLG